MKKIHQSEENRRANRNRARAAFTSAYGGATHAQITDEGEGSTFLGSNRSRYNLGDGSRWVNDCEGAE